MKICPYCKSVHAKKGVYCSRSCSNKSRNHVFTEEEKTLRSLKTKELWQDENYRSKVISKLIEFNDNKIWNAEQREKHAKIVARTTKGKYREKPPSSILHLSSRTVQKLLKRMKLPCSRCGWNEGTCDIHHINGRKIENADDHSNLTYICPNCHREFHSGNVDIQEEFIPLSEYIGDSWKEYYYG